MMKPTLLVLPDKPAYPHRVERQYLCNPFGIQRSKTVIAWYDYNWGSAKYEEIIIVGVAPQGVIDRLSKKLVRHGAIYEIELEDM